MIPVSGAYGSVVKGGGGRVGPSRTRGFQSHALLPLHRGFLRPIEDRASPARWIPQGWIGARAETT